MSVGVGARPPGHRGRGALIGAGLGFTIADPFSSGATNARASLDNADPASLYTVSRQDLSSQTQVPATLGYAGSYSVVNQARGR